MHNEDELLYDLIERIRASGVPTVFCDFDGVLNVMPYDRVWVGDDEKNGAWNSYGIWDKNNWKVVEVAPDPKKHFVWDNIVDMPSENGTFTLRVSTELATRLGDLIRSGAIQFVWLTTWREEAVKLLNPLLGFPEDTPYLPWARRRSDYTHIGKFTALREFMEAIAPEERQPFIWIDDVATHDFINNAKKHTRSTFDFKKKLGVSSLILETDPLYGISRSEMKRIDSFLLRQQPKSE
jgi:hypothetical protein